MQFWNDIRSRIARGQDVDEAIHEAANGGN